MCQMVTNILNYNDLK